MRLGTFKVADGEIEDGGRGCVVVHECRGRLRVTASNSGSLCRLRNNSTTSPTAKTTGGTVFGYRNQGRWPWEMVEQFIKRGQEYTRQVRTAT